MTEPVKPKIFNIWAFKLKKNFADPWFKEKIVAMYCVLTAFVKVEVMTKQHIGREGGIGNILLQGPYMPQKWV